MGGTEVARYFARHGGRGVARVVLVGTITPCLMKRPDNVDGIDPATLAACADLLARDFPAWIAANTKPFFTPATSAAMVTWGQAMMLSPRSEEHTSELQSLMRISYAVFCLKKTTTKS